MTGDEMPLEMAARLHQLNSLLGDLNARLPAARRDIAWLIDDHGFGERERSPTERQLDAVEAALRRSFRAPLTGTQWRDVAVEVLAAAETGI